MDISKFITKQNKIILFRYLFTFFKNSFRQSNNLEHKMEFKIILLSDR